MSKARERKAQIEKSTSKSASKQATKSASALRESYSPLLHTSEVPKEHEFTDSPFDNEITMHTNIRVFNISILYTLVAASSNPMMDVVREQVQTNEHLIRVTIAGPRLEEIPACDIYESIATYRSRTSEAASSNSHHVGTTYSIRTHDSEADYYGIVAAERLIRETNGQAQILGVDVDEVNIASIFINAVAG